MTQPSRSRTSHDSGSIASQGGYHPRCGAQHDHKPAKAMVGVGLLVALSFVLYELKSPTAGPSPDTGAQHQALAHR